MPSLKQKQYFEQGINAALCNKALDDCPYKKAERKSAWVRGWHEGKLNKNIIGVTPVQQRSNQDNINHLKHILTTAKCSSSI